jgi:hypothetical protein
MNDVRIARITGAFGLACVALTFGQFPLWTIGSAPSVYDGPGFGNPDPSADLVLDGQRHSDPAMRHGPQLDGESGLIEMGTNHVAAFRVQDSRG